MTAPGKIYAAMCAIMEEVPAIAKGRTNSGQGYKFRGVDDVYFALNTVLTKHKVFTLPKILNHTRETHLSNAGKELLYSILEIEYTFYCDDGSFVTASVVGEGMDSGDKASNKGMSVAHKYCLLQAFCIPTEDAKDPENDNHDIASKGSAGTSDQTLPLVTEPQLKRLTALQLKHGITDAQISSHLFGLKLGARSELNRSQYDELIKKIEAIKPQERK